MYNQKFLSPHLSKGKNYIGYNQKNLSPSIFMAKNKVLERLKKRRIYKMFKIPRAIRKKKKAKECDILCLLQCIYYISDIRYADQTVFLAVVPI